jgi:hypothetical protein
MSCALENGQLSLFAERLPYRPYCSDDLSDGLRILPAQSALEKRYIQYNPPAMIHWLAFDVDRRYIGLENEWRMLPPPNIAVISPGTGRHHCLYGIAAGVSTTIASRDKPMRLLEAVYEGYRHELDADPGFAQLICKNPLHPHWITHLLREDLYDLSELAEYVDLNAADKRIRKIPRKHRQGIGRNCCLFDSLRTWAYRWVDEYRSNGFSSWQAAIMDRTEKLNIFTDPLPLSEIRATARSVAKWTWQHYDGKMTASSLAADGLTPEAFSMLQSNLGKMGMAKRWGDNSEKKAEAQRMHAAGMKQAEIMQELQVDRKTVYRWLKEAAKKNGA